MNVREGDLIETLDDNIFDVKGLVHPPEKVIAFIRFTPDLTGDRRRGNVTYRKVYPLHERYVLLQERFQQYLVYDTVFGEWLCEVPIYSIKRHYKPIDCLRKLCERRNPSQPEIEARQFAELLKKEANIPRNQLGISGSLLTGLNTSRSDIDIIVYGSQNCQKVFSTLGFLVKRRASQVKSYGLEDLKKLFNFRSKDTAMRFEDFVATESRKFLQGRFNSRDYYIRCIKDWNEVEEQYGTVHYQSMGYAKIKAEITDDSQRIFTPCDYKITNVELIEGPQPMSVEEIVSFRGRFCEQAIKGETIIAQGKVELVRKKDGSKCCRMILGNKVTDYMVLG